MTNQNSELVGTYVGAVAARMSVSGVDEAVVEEVISVQQALLSELAEDGVDLEAELGSPQDYAAEVAHEVADAAEEESTDTAPWGLFLRHGRSRIWNPEDPRVLQPHLLGIGWSVNFGALAVRLGLIRPDDEDVDTLSSIPAPVIRVISAVPAVLTVAQAVTLVSQWDELPAQRERFQPSRGGMVANLGISGALAVITAHAAKRGDREDLLNTSAVGTLLGGAGLTSLCARVGKKNDPRRTWARDSIGGVVAVVAAALIEVAPRLSGICRLWRAQGVTGHGSTH